MYKNKKIIKTLLLISLFSLISLMSISCKSNNNPTFKPSELVGTWKSTVGATTFDLKSDGSMVLKLTSGNVNLTIADWDSAKDKSVGSYSLNLKSGNDTYTFKFTSSSECEVTYSAQAGVVEPFKKQ